MAVTSAAALRDLLDAFSGQLIALQRFASPLELRVVTPEFRNELKFAVNKFEAFETILSCYLDWLVAEQNNPAQPEEFTCGQPVVPMPDQPPNADAGGPYAGQINIPLRVNGGGTSDPDTPLTDLFFRWEWGDGEVTTGNGLIDPEHVYVTAGLYTLSLTVSDPNGLFDNDITQVTISTAEEPIAPVADANGPYSVQNCTSPCSTPTPGQILIADGRGSTFDPRWMVGQILFSWDWGDGTAVSQGFGLTRPQHTYSLAGPFPKTVTVILTITDPANQSDTDTATVTVTQVVTNTPPNACLTGPSSLTIGQVGTFDASCTTDAESADTLLTFRWNWGDGSAEETGPGTTHLTRTHSYASAGVFTITLTVTDPGNLTDSTTHTVTVPNPPANTAPVADITGPTSVVQGQVNLYDARGTADAETPNAQLTFRYAWGDGTADNVGVGLETQNHTYANAGNFTITLTVTDPGGLQGVDTHNVTVGAPPPPPAGGNCSSNSGCHYLNSHCICSGASCDPPELALPFWNGYCCDDITNFRSISGGTEGQMTHNANCLRRPPQTNRWNIHWEFDLKLDATWLNTPSTAGRHLGGVWAIFGNGITREEHEFANIRIDFGRVRDYGVYCNVFVMRNAVLTVDVPNATSIPGAFQAGVYRRIIFNANYTASAGRISGTIEYVGLGTRSFSVTHANAVNLPLNGWNWAGFGNIDNNDGTLVPYGATFRNIVLTVS